MPRPLRAVFLNQGTGGRAILGHANVEAVVRPRVEADGRLDARFVGLPPLRGLAAAAVRPVPGLARLDADLQTVRWHVAQGARARSVLRDVEGEGPIDALHVHSHAIGLTMAGRLRRTPTALSVDVTVWDHHAMGIWRPVRRHSRAVLAPSLALEQRAFSAAAVVIAWSEWARRSVLAASPGANVVVLHPGIDAGRYIPRPGPGVGPLRVLFVGSHFQQKGGPDLLAALGARLDEGTVILDVVTQSDLPPRRGVTVHRLTPGSDALLGLLAAADVFCLPTLADASPWAVLEAMAAGLPVVTTAVGGVPDLVGPDGSQLLVPSGDVAALREALDRLLGDSSRRTALGDAARSRVLRHFDADRNTTALVDLLVGITGR